MGEVLYEVSYQFEPHVLIPLAMLIGIPIFAKTEEKRNGKAASKGTKAVLAVVWCFVFAIAVWVGKYQIDLYNTVIGAYKSGEYRIVVGYVENFDPMPPEGHKEESFDISGVHFSYSDYTVMTGYNNAKSKGGVITGDGQYLKIGYVYYDVAHENIIVYIEELPPPP